MDEITVCRKCENPNVEIRLWVNQSTGETSGETGNDEDTWCPTCQGHTGVKIITIKNKEE